MNAKHTIKAIEITGGFLEDQKIEFSEKMNCIIGPRGTGKTTVLEFIRYALDGASNQNKKIEKLVDNNLKSGRIKLSIRTKDGLEYNVERSQNEGQSVFDADFNPTNISLGQGTIFTTDIYSQNQIEEIAEDPQFQIKLIDKFRSSEIREIENQIATLQRDLKENSRLILEAQQETNRLGEKLGELPNIEGELKKYASTAGDKSEKINKAHEEKSLREREMVLINSSAKKFEYVQEQLDYLKQSLLEIIPDISVEEVLTGPNAKFFKEFVDQTSVKINNYTEAISEISSQVKIHVDRTYSKLDALEVIHKSQDQQFRELLEQHKEFQEKATERIRLEKLRNELLSIKKEYDDKKKSLSALRKDREKLIHGLTELRQKRFDIREEVVEYLNGEVKDVQISIQQEQNITFYKELLISGLKGSRTEYNSYIPKIMSAFHPMELFDILENGEHPVEELCREANIIENQANAVVNNFKGSDQIYDIQTVEIMDEPTIKLKDGEQYKPSEDLSTGQKCTAILPILLLENEAPLLIDQPEDNLDNAFISEIVVPGIEKVKSKRQLIFITHNPNIPVLSEAEQIIVLESDGMRANVKGTGDIDERRSDIEKFLEGGRDAFLRRAERYKQGN